VKTIIDITSVLKSRKKYLFEHYGILNLALFGSYSRYEQSADSDVDILVEFSRPIGIEFIDLAEDLERILELKVDLVSKNGIKPKYFQAIQNDLIYV